MYKQNFFLATDSYKISHYMMYPKDTNKVYSYIESRGGIFDDTVFFGLQYFLKELNNMFPTIDDVEEAREECEYHGMGFNYEGAKALVELGYFPIKVKAVPEGTVLKNRNVLVTVENTKPEFYWLTSYIETMMLRVMWYATTVATHSFQCKKVIKSYLEETSDDVDSLPIRLNDFGARGVSSAESAAIGGAAHLVNFIASDTLEGRRMLRRYYHARNDVAMGVPAAEHSTVTSFGKEREKESYEHIMDVFPTGLISIVSDSYDIYNAVQNIFGKQLKDKVLERDGVLVVRPDSGDPVEMVPEILQMLWNEFGGTENSKGYKVLFDKVRVIQGDGISYKSIPEILEAVKKQGFSTENLVLGMGGKLLQDHNRDDLKFAMKCSYMEVNGKGRDVFKDPVTDKGKVSKKGRLALVEEGDEYVTVREEELNGREDKLLEVYKDGVLLKDDTIDAIRERANF